jgi:PAS domain S-box-containing protein
LARCYYHVSFKAMIVPHLSTLTRVVILTAFYFVGGLLGKESSFMSGNVTLVWPPSGIALAAILLFGYRFWPGVAAGAILFTVLKGTPFGFFTITTALGNTMGALVCAFLLERFIKFRAPLERVRDVTGFVLFACVLGTTVNAAFNVVGLCYAGQVSWDAMFPSLLQWWVPNAMGALVVAPAIMAWGSRASITWRPRLMAEAALCAAGLVAGTLVSFNSWFVNGIENYPLAYLPYPFLVWGALRFGQRGATTGTLLVATLAISQLLHGRGPFQTGVEQESLMLIGCYIGILAVTNMFLAAAAVEREQAVNATIASEKRYRAIIEDQTDLICRFKPDGTILFVNYAYCRFHAKRREELIGTNFFPSMPEQDRDIPLGHFGSLTPEQAVLSYDNKVSLADGQFVWQQCSIRALFDERGGIFEFQAVMQDITRRKESEEAMRFGEERLRAILHSMVDGVVVVDEHGAITSCNPAAEKIFGRNSKEVVHRALRNFFSPEDQALYNDYLSQYLHQSEPKIIEVTALRHDGTSLPIDLAASQISRTGGQMLIVVVRDISGRKRLEEQFRQSQKMEAIGRLAGGIAHDFNNLMQAILGYSNLLNQRLAPGDPQRETVDQIEKSADRATALTRQLLAFSRKQVLQPKLLALNTVVAEMNKLLRRLIGEVIHLEIRLGNPTAHVRADPGQLEQVILNLSINARDAMPKGGTLFIETTTVELDGSEHGFSGPFKPGSYASIRITDTGSGMAPEVQAHLFEPFFTTKELGKGTGLGLSIVYGIVKQSGGEITVNSEVGRGTTFQIFLPRCEAEVSKAEAERLAAPNTAGTETILLVEDEELVRLMLVEVLKSEGYQVLEAGHGVEALAMAARHEGPIHLLITDMLMPELNGWELASRLVEVRRNLPVLYMSGYTDDEATSYGKLENIGDFLQKPFRPDALLLKARQILDANQGS